MTILNKALQVAGSGGERDYDHPILNFLRICIGWSRIAKTIITPEMYVLMMFEMKIQRQVGTHNDDNFVDIIGYGKCISEIDQMLKEVKGYGIEKFREMKKISEMEDMLDDFEKLFATLNKKHITNEEYTGEVVVLHELLNRITADNLNIQEM